MADPKDGNDLRLMSGKTIEKDQRAYLAEICDACAPDRFIDCGANAGIYAITLAKRSAFPRGVDAFEPIPKTFSKLVANVAINELLNRVRTHRIALGERAGSAKAFTTAGASGRATLLRKKSRAVSQKEVEVEVRSLDSIIESKDETIAMKVDVEGYEPQVLKGAKRTLSNNRVVLQVECYAKDPMKELTEALPAEFMLLKQIGPDHYFANFDPFHHVERSEGANMRHGAAEASV